MRPALVVVGLALAAASAAGAPRPGKVVRVERGPRKPSGIPRMCQLLTPGSSDAQGICFGIKPEIGARLAVLDSHRNLGVLRVDGVTAQSGCGGPVTASQSAEWLLQGRFETFDATTPPDTQLVAVLDVPVDSRLGHIVVDPDRLPADRDADTAQITAIDNNGDGSADLEFVSFGCDEQGSPAANATGKCVEVWYLAGRGFERLRADRMRTECY
jgi:hypothetical protein